MAEAIFSVLKEGLSLSQAARKYDIPYPTFVLYANRVHNMLGPSADGGSGKSLTSINCIRKLITSEGVMIDLARPQLISTHTLQKSNPPKSQWFFIGPRNRK